MKTERYQELFDHAAFPVFSTNGNGVVIYKNPTARKYLPMIRKNASVLRHLHGGALPHCANAVKIIGNTPYRHAVVMPDESGWLFIALSRFQYDDGEQVISRLIEKSGASLMDFENAETATSSPHHPYRITTDLLSILSVTDVEEQPSFFAFSEIIEEIFPKLNRAFGALGYRMVAHSEEYLSRVCAEMNVYDFLFLFGKLLYLQMRLSQNKSIDVFATSNDITQHHHIRLKTGVSLAKGRISNNLDFVCLHTPEYTQEFLLLDRVSQIFRETVFSVDINGIFSIDLKLPYVQKPAELIVRSTSDVMRLTAVIDRMLVNVEKDIRDIFASC